MALLLLVMWSTEVLHPFDTTTTTQLGIALLLMLLMLAGLGWAGLGWAGLGLILLLLATLWPMMGVL